MNPLPHPSAGIRLGIASLALLAASAVAARAEDVTKSFAVSGRANVRVESNDGSVRVTSGDSKQVEFRVEYQGYELGKNLRVDAHQDGDKVELTARVTGHWGFSFGHNSRHLHIEVRMPRDADLQVETGDGSVQAESINGTVNVHTGDGSVKAKSLNGAIDLHTNDGSITVENLKGDMRLRTGDGSIEAHDLDGKVEADSGDGHSSQRSRVSGCFRRAAAALHQARDDVQDVHHHDRDLGKHPGRSAAEPLQVGHRAGHAPCHQDRNQQPADHRPVQLAVDRDVEAQRIDATEQPKHLRRTP